MSSASSFVVCFWYFRLIDYVLWFFWMETVIIMSQINRSNGKRCKTGSDQSLRGVWSGYMLFGNMIMYAICKLRIKPSRGLNDDPTPIPTPWVYRSRCYLKVKTIYDLHGLGVDSSGCFFKVLSGSGTILRHRVRVKQCDIRCDNIACICKQCKSRSGGSWLASWSGSTLFATRSVNGMI